MNCGLTDEAERFNACCHGALCIKPWPSFRLCSGMLTSRENRLADS
jgi:hypothetical protein